MKEPVEINNLNFESLLKLIDIMEEDLQKRSQPKKYISQWFAFILSTKVERCTLVHAQVEYILDNNSLKINK